MSELKTMQPPRAVVSAAKAEGSLLALAAGDALGWPQELPRRVRDRKRTESPRIGFTTWTRRSGDRFRPFDETIKAGEYSDDTQLTLAVARCRVNHGEAWRESFQQVELPRWTIYQRGGGGATMRAARSWVGGGAPWLSAKAGVIHQYFNAGGNGVAMRVLPHALFLAGHDGPTDLVRDVVRDGAATHGHPRALVGATAWAYAAWSLLRLNQTLGFGELLDQLIDERGVWGAFPDAERGGKRWLDAAKRVFGESYQHVWERTVGEMRKLLEQARKGVSKGVLANDRAVLADLGCFEKFKGAGTVTAAASAYLATRYAAQPTQGVLRAAFEQGADTDTLAAMTGGLLGCLVGDEWLPTPWRNVQDADYLRHIADRVARGPAGTKPQPVERPFAPRSILADLERDGIHELALGDSTRVKAVPIAEPRPATKSITVRAWKLTTPPGQTLYVNRVYKLKRTAKGGELARDATSGQMTLSDTGASASGGSGPGTARDVVAKRVDSTGALYCEFLRLLRILLHAQPKRPCEIEEALELTHGQARMWLARAQQSGEIERVSKRPVLVALRRKPLR